MFNIKCKPIFPTELYFVDIYDEIENEKYRRELINLSITESSKIVSNRNGWQSDITLWQNETFKSLLEKSSVIIQSIISDISSNKPEFVIRSMWGNINPKGGFNFTHVHPTGWLSAVYYVSVPEGCPGITFQDPRPAKMMDFQNSCLVDDLYHTHHPKNGELILFPSWLPHFVDPNQSNQDRISISFNVELLV
jgi:uncharacterized protein (TIGR02466 family)